MTFVTSGRIASFQFPAEHFSHVFLDEAGHAVEPEAVVAIAGQSVSQNSIAAFQAGLIHQNKISQKMDRN